MFEFFSSSTTRLPPCGSGADDHDVGFEVDVLA